MKKIKHIALLFSLLFIVLQSCVPTKNVREVNKTVPEYYQGNSTRDTLNSASISWRSFFKDRQLNALIDTALVNNQELNIMLQKIAVAKNEIKARKGEYLPFINYGAGSEVEKVGEFTRNGSVETNLSVREGKAFPEPLTNYSLGLSASWELDVWKKLRNSKKACLKLRSRC